MPTKFRSSTKAVKKPSISSSNSGGEDLISLSRETSTLPQPAFYDDKIFFRIVIWFSGLALLVSIAGIIALYFKDEKPEGLIAVASSLVGLLAGTFAYRKH